MKAVTVLGIAGLLSLAGGASAAFVGPADDMPTENTAPLITLGEEEISDVSLATSYIFDKENAGAHRPGLQLAKSRGRSRAVYRGGGGGFYAAPYGGGGSYGGGGGGSAGGPDGM
jgi:hypothetical protein